MAQELTERRQHVMSSVCVNEVNENTHEYTSEDIHGAISKNKNTGDDMEAKSKLGHYCNAKYTMPTPATNVAQYGFRDSILDGVLSHLGTKLDVATIFKIQTLGVCHNNEVQFGPYLIDIVAETTQARKIAIEYDGPTHFYAETTMRTAKSILKHEILENTGWQVLHIPYQEWLQLPLKRKRQHLLKVNEEILKEYIEAIQRGESSDKPVENNTQSETDIIADELCTLLMEGTSNIIDIDEESKSSDKTMNDAEKQANDTH
uniref:RAP domain-containing protein n=1 Tax=Babesia bovis TaxID=5865 RepID=A7APT9_BABBO|eukprot:XP_001612141.1 hypothetical protein [Babesia bovis T2Bo]